MAEEEKEPEEVEEGKKDKKSPLVLIIVIVVLILVILIGAVVAILFMGDDEAQMQQQQQQMQQPQANERQMPNRSQSNRVPAASFSEIGVMFPLDNFTVNLLSENGRRYLKVEMNLELSGEELGEELETRKAVIRDIIIRLLSSKSLEEISTAKGKDKLKSQIVDQLNMRLSDGHIQNVFFTEFVIQ
jgi:flagellar FliL protein